MARIDISFLKQFSEVTGVAVRIVDNDKELNPNLELSEKELSRNVSCRFDAEAGVMFLRVRDDETLSPSYIEGQITMKVITGVIAKRGLESFFNEEEQKRFVASLEGTLRSTDRNAHLSSLPEELKYQLSYLLSENQAMTWMIKSYIEGVTGLRLVGKYETALRDSQIFHAKAGISEDYLKVGFPQSVLFIKPDDLSSFLEKTHTPFSMLPDDYMDKILHPLAIIQQGVENKNGEKKCLAVTGIRLKDGSFLTLSLPSPERIQSDRAANPQHVLLGAYPLFFSEKKVFQLFKYSRQNTADYNRNNLKANTILFLQETVPGRSYRYKLLDYFEDNIYKIGTEVAPVLSGSDVQSLRNCIANVRNNFENPKKSESFFNAVEMKRRENEKIRQMLAESDRMRESQEAEKRLAEAKAPAPVNVITGNGVIPDISERKETDIMSLAVSEKVIRKTSIAKLEKLNARTVKDLYSYGERYLKSVIGQAEFEKLEAFVNKKANWTLRQRERVPLETEFAAMSDDEKRVVVSRDVQASSLRCPGTKELASMLLPFPVGRDGKPFHGLAGMSLLLKEAAFGKRWDGCPYFYTSKELDEIGFRPETGAEPIHVAVDGKYISLYNIKDTTMFSERPDIYNALLAAAKTKIPQADDELRSIVDASHLRFDGKQTMFPEHYYNAAYEEALSKCKISQGCSLTRVMGRSVLDKLISSAQERKASVRQRAEEVKAEMQKRTIIESHRLPTDSPENWFHGLSLEEKLQVLGHPDANMAQKDLFASGLLTNKADDNLEKALQKQFMALSAKEKEMTVLRHEAYNEMAGKLKSGQYDITDVYPFRLAQIKSVSLSIKDGLVSIAVQRDNECVFRKVRMNALSPDQIDSLTRSVRKQIETIHREALVRKNEAMQQRAADSASVHNKQENTNHRKYNS